MDPSSDGWVDPMTVMADPGTSSPPPPSDGWTDPMQEMATRPVNDVPPAPSDGWQDPLVAMGAVQPYVPADQIYGPATAGMRRVGGPQGIVGGQTIYSQIGPDLQLATTIPVSDMTPVGDQDIRNPAFDAQQQQDAPPSSAQLGVSAATVNRGLNAPLFNPMTGERVYSSQDSEEAYRNAVVPKIVNSLIEPWVGSAEDRLADLHSLVAQDPSLAKFGTPEGRAHAEDLGALVMSGGVGAFGGAEAKLATEMLPDALGMTGVKGLELAKAIRDSRFVTEDIGSAQPDPSTLLRRLNDLREGSLRVNGKTPYQFASDLKKEADLRDAAFTGQRYKSVRIPGGGPGDETQTIEGMGSVERGITTKVPTPEYEAHRSTQVDPVMESRQRIQQAVERLKQLNSPETTDFIAAHRDPVDQLLWYEKHRPEVFDKDFIDRAVTPTDDPENFAANQQKTINEANEHIQNMRDTTALDGVPFDNIEEHYPLIQANHPMSDAMLAEHEATRARLLDEMQNAHNTHLSGERPVVAPPEVAPVPEVRPEDRFSVATQPDGSAGVLDNATGRVTAKGLDVESATKQAQAATDRAISQARPELPPTLEDRILELDKAGRAPGAIARELQSEISQETKGAATSPAHRRDFVQEVLDRHRETPVETVKGEIPGTEQAVLPGLPKEAEPPRVIAGSVPEGGPKSVAELRRQMVDDLKTRIEAAASPEERKQVYDAARAAGVRDADLRAEGISLAKAQGAGETRVPLASQPLGSRIVARSAEQQAAEKGEEAAKAAQEARAPGSVAGVTGVQGVGPAGGVTFGTEGTTFGGVDIDKLVSRIKDETPYRSIKEFGAAVRSGEASGVAPQDLIDLFRRGEVEVGLRMRGVAEPEIQKILAAHDAEVGETIRGEPPPPGEPAPPGVPPGADRPGFSKNPMPTTEPTLWKAMNQALRNSSIAGQLGPTILQLKAVGDASLLALKVARDMVMTLPGPFHAAGHTPGEILGALHASFVRDGTLLNEISDAFKTLGSAYQDIEKIQPDLQAARRGELGIAGSVVAKVGDAAANLNPTGRFISAMTAIPLRVVRNYELYRQAYSQAIAGGMDAETAHLAGLSAVHAPSPTQIDAATTVARRTMLVDANPASDAFNAGIAWLDKRGPAGVAAATALRINFPFVKFASNALRESIAYLPGWNMPGLVSALNPAKIAAAGTTEAAAKAAGQITQEAAMALRIKAVIGAGAFYKLGDVAADGNLTGDKGDPKNGIPPNSVRIGGRWFPNMMFLGLSPILNQIGNYHDDMQTLSPDEQNDRAYQMSAYLHASWNTLVDTEHFITRINTLKDLFDQKNDPTHIKMVAYELNKIIPAIGAIHEAEYATEPASITKLPIPKKENVIIDPNGWVGTLNDAVMKDFPPALRELFDPKLNTLPKPYIHRNQPGQPTVLPVLGQEGPAMPQKQVGSGGAAGPSGYQPWTPPTPTSTQ